jgi:hypothetical protein
MSPSNNKQTSGEWDKSRKRRLLRAVYFEITSLSDFGVCCARTRGKQSRTWGPLHPLH